MNTRINRMLTLSIAALRRVNLLRIAVALALLTSAALRQSSRPKGD